MKFYRENKVNPAASCLPILLQIPIFIALFFVLRDFDTEVFPEYTELGRSDLAGRHRPRHHREHQHALVGLAPARDLHRQPGRLDVLHVGDDGQSPARPSSSRCRSSSSFFIVNFPMGLMLYWVTTNLWTVGPGPHHAPARAEAGAAAEAHVARRRPRSRAAGDRDGADGAEAEAAAAGGGAAGSSGCAGARRRRARRARR